jgi:23S rRNA pseudouridine955/2504/2580 synthase
MNGLSKVSAIWLEIDEGSEDQRVDNFLLKVLKGVPKSHVYRILRSGEVRVNSGRVSAEYRLKVSDKVRIPPIRTSPLPTKPGSANRPKVVISPYILFENEDLVAIDKPSGMAVHGGSGVNLGVIELLRAERPESTFLELVHRLDRDTSGCLLIAKKRRALVAMHGSLRDGKMDKRYVALVKGKWDKKQLSAKFSLHKFVTDMGERRVVVDEEGQYAHTILTLRQAWDPFSLLEAKLLTGRTHQIRVHLAHLGFPIAGDDKYGDFAWNKVLIRQGFKRMFLHAESLVLPRPGTGELLKIEAPLPESFRQFTAMSADLGTGTIQP